MVQLIADANLVISYFADDSNSEMAFRVVDAALNGEVELLVPDVVIAECCHVFLMPKFGYSKKQIAEVMTSLIMSPGIRTDFDKTVLVKALRQFHENNVDFPDVYLSARSAESSLPIVTFDKDFRKLEGRVVNPQDSDLF